MFGKPQWFRPKKIGWGLVPITWQGWLYTGGWVGAILAPFFLLLSRYQPLEAMAWMAVSGGALLYDVWHIRCTMFAPPQVAAAQAPKAEDNVLYILDSQPGQQAATRNYNLQVRS